MRCELFLYTVQVSERLGPDETPLSIMHFKGKNQGFEKENTGRRNGFLTGREKRIFYQSGR